MKCKNCWHKIKKINRVWKHMPNFVSACGYSNCEWNCGCEHPVPDLESENNAV